MPSLSETPKKSFAVYYGHEHISKLVAYRTVVVQPAHYQGHELRWLRAQGVNVLAYLSVGEDPNPEPSAWSRRRRNPAWNTWYVKVGHPAWRAHLHNQAGQYLEHCSGLFLDTLDGSVLFPTERTPLLRAVRSLRKCFPAAYLLANRGFDLLPELGRAVNGVLIESFTTSWEDGYRELRPDELAYTGAMLERVRAHNLDVFALDYALRPHHRRAATQRARALGVPNFVSVRELTAL